MAISIDSTTNLHIIDQAESTTGWTFSGITKTATSTASREGTNCVGGQVPLNSYGYAWHTHGSSINMTTAGNERVYIWVNSVGPGTKAQNGWMVVIGDGTNRRAYTIGGSDDVPFSVKGWNCLMLDTANLPTTFQQIAGGAPNLSAITDFGFGIYNTVAPSGNALNVFADVVRYGSGLVVTSGATDDITLADIAADDFSGASGKAYGIIREIQPGVYGIQGDILFGNTAGGSIDWKETNSVVIFEDRVRGTGTNTKFKLSGQHSTTGTFSAELGISVSSGDTESGRSGVTFISANPDNQPIDFDFSDADIENVFLYGCTLTNMRGGTIAFSSDATNGANHHISGTSFSGCSKIDIGRAATRNCLFAATSDIVAALLWNSNINIKNSQLIGNTIGAAIEMTETTNQDYDNLIFTGNTNDTILNNGTPGTNIDISKTNGSNPSTYENASGNTATITYVGAAVTVQVIAATGAGIPVGGSRVHLEALDGTGPFPFDDTVTIVNSGTTATVTHNAHALATNDKVVIRGASHQQNNGSHTITVTGTNTYTYTMSSAPGSNPTGTIKSTFVALDGIVNTTTGILSTSRVYPSTQPVRGWTRKSTIILTTAGSFTTGYWYTIQTIGTTDFTAIGADSNTVGLKFRATGAGTGTGTATESVFKTSQIAGSISATTGISAVGVMILDE